MPQPKSSRTVIVAPDAAAPVGAYSQAIAHDGLLFCSGQGNLSPVDGTLVSGSLTEETRQTLENLAAVCDAAGTDLSRALKTNIYTTEMQGFAEINAAYASFFPTDPPARTTIGVADLPVGVRVEIEAVVALP